MRAARLAREVIKNDCFDRLRAELGDGFAAEVARRVRAVAGDVGQDGLGLDDEGRAALAASDIVIHSAATVSFDAPLTQAVEINLLGPPGSRRRGRLRIGRAPDLRVDRVRGQHASGRGQGGAALGEPVHARHRLGGRGHAARRLRDDLQAASRRPTAEPVHQGGPGEIGGAGDHLIAARAEKIREEWVRTELVDAGTARAHSLGWPDAYPFTKAMGERVLVEQWAGTVPITFVRPSIIESALSEPRPGWIRGFRMAEPIIVSYARGLLREFPVCPRASSTSSRSTWWWPPSSAWPPTGPTRDGRRCTTWPRACGTRFPTGTWSSCARTGSAATRSTTSGAADQRARVVVPRAGRVQRQLRRADQAMTVAERLMTALPVRGKQAELAARIEDSTPGQAGPRLRRALRGLHRDRRPLPGRPADRAVGHLRRRDHARVLLRPRASSTGTTTCTTCTCRRWSSTPACARRPGKSVVEKRPERARKAILSPDRHLAVFDLEHTLMASNVVDTYAWLASRHLPPARRARFVADLLRQAPSLLALDRRDRGDFLRSFYRRFEDAPIAQLRADSWELFHRQLLTRSFPEGFARVRAHRALGHRTLLITGALDFIIEPVRPLFDDIVCAQMERARRPPDRAPHQPAAHRRGAGPRAGRLRRAHDLSLEESVAYADSASDLAMLEAVGFPVAVNPESRLAPSPGGGAGTWSTGPRRRAGRTGRCRSGPFDVKSPKAVMGMRG
jgi:fatty acyl-CoA reductase